MTTSQKCTRAPVIPVLVISILLAFNCAAEEKDLLINAESISYSGNSVVAEGSVEAIYKDVKISGGRLDYNKQTRIVHVEGGYVFYYGGIIFVGSTLDYEMDKDRGRGEKVSIQYENVNLEGRVIDFNRDEIKLYTAAFDTCGIKPVPHYHVSAHQISLYPQSNWMISYWAIFWLNQIPTIPMPVYIYDFEAERKGRTNVIPYPEVGSNAEDGWFIHEKSVWYLKRELNGSFTINYAEKKGVGAGTNVNYIANKENQGTFWIYGDFFEPFSTGLTHHYYFGPPSQDFSPRFLKDIFSAVQFNRFDLQTDLSLREKINYEKVTKLPDVAIKIRDPKIKISAGMISENSREAFTRLNAACELEKKVFESNGFLITPGINLDYSRYSGGLYWLKNSARITFKKDWIKPSSAYLGFSHFINNQGESPFQFEKYRFIDSDQVFAGLTFEYAKTKFTIETVHNLPAGNPQEIDYSFEAGIHCFAVGLKYRAMRNEFNLIFNIL